MDRNSWKIIAELRRTPNITKAADRLAMTQPALSKRLRLIEEDLGVRLVIRTPKGVSFTPEGEYVAQEAKKLLAHFAEIRSTLLHFGDHRSGTIRIGMTNSFLRYTLPSHLKDYKAQYPGIEFDTVTDVSSGIAERMERGEIHVGFIYGEIDGRFDRIRIGQEQACLVNIDEIALADLPSARQISYISDPFARRLLDSWWSSHFTRPPLIGMRANHGETCLEMIANGLGYGLFLSPKFVVGAPALYRAPLYFADGTPVARNAWMISRPDFQDMSLVADFLQYMKRSIV